MGLECLFLDTVVEALVEAVCGCVAIIEGSSEMCDYVNSLT
jgi:hypothetical protein